MDASTSSAAAEFAGRNVRFTGGRTEHRTRIPAGDRWFEDQLEAACGKKGWLARGYTNKPVRPCAACLRVVGQAGETAAV